MASFARAPTDPQPSLLCGFVPGVAAIAITCTSVVGAVSGGEPVAVLLTGLAAAAAAAVAALLLVRGHRRMGLVLFAAAAVAPPGTAATALAVTSAAALLCAFATLLDPPGWSSPHRSRP